MGLRLLDQFLPDRWKAAHLLDGTPVACSAH